ncbi:MAG: DUF5009 domain-containing protein [Tidjanibacter sp.]|nr:DUF5009 domain-containing protein [Tidjanibacter sp.]MBR3931340.1 DUF5009 domain-containing protein [Tidjanibacter sp.]
MTSYDSSTNVGTSTPPRLLSLDALRGFDMFFIIGGAGLIAAICGLFPSSEFAGWLSAQMHHVEWNGFSHHDTIFPLFLFIAGISFPLSLRKQQLAGATRGRICLRIVRRVVLLILLGLVYNGLFRLQLDTLRWPSVLGRIGVAWGVAALLTVWLKPKSRALIAVALLVGYSLLLTIPAPDVAEGVGPLTKEGNLVGFVDRLLIPNHIYWRGVMDPEGVLSTLPAVVTALLGVFTGEWIGHRGVSGGRKALAMIVASVVMLALGMAWNLWQPINKMLWSSAFVLTAGAYSLAVFALFYYLIDVRGYRRWAEVLRVVGVNSITIYMLQEIVSFGGVSQFFLGGLAGVLPEGWGAVVLSLGYVVACWLVLYLLDRKKIHLKV